MELTKPWLPRGQRPDDQSVETLLVLTPPVNDNITTFDVLYTWPQLAKLPHLRVSDHDTRLAVCPNVSAMGNSGPLVRQ
ncbi:hypothetical protein B1H18_02745 [Streptomyces tsukubensis]|uniref:Uncharacterized protein n=1 Tax=Streptomyces tsukubensis TaxID=83656 RepID=A0A1V4AH46_9ACTN|nr:hypothetical protein B1H18_02745 [Streptomyces tsukubensis]